MLEDFKKAKPPTFDGEVKKLEDVEGSLLGMKKFFRVQLLKEHDKNVATLILKGKLDIFLEVLKIVKDIREEELFWRDFEGYLGENTHLKGILTVNQRDL